MKPGDSALLAVSGGADSMAMLHLFHRLSKKWNLALAVGHVNHNLRGKTSQKDLEFVERWAQTLNLLFFSESVDVRGYAKRKHLGVEEAARELRYKALDKMARRAGCKKIATAHTLEDQAETVLMRILRGTGLIGLAGIPSQRVLSSGVLVVRPLLTISREDLRATLRRERISFREDASNKSPRYLRNVIRRKTIPLLEKISPRLQEHLARLASSAASLVESPALGYNKGLGCEILKRAFPKMGYGQVLDLWRRINSGKEDAARILDLCLKR